jgi:RNA polymerase sigma-70 factor (ECF subfamily)
VPSRTPPDRRAEFEALTLPLLDPLYNLAYVLTRRRADAEDLVQETYLRAWRFFDSFEAGTNVRAWLFRILRNAFVQRYRAQRARIPEVEIERIEAVYERLVDETFVTGSHGASPEQLLLDSRLDPEVERALAAIPEEFREVIVLALVEELSYREIAETLSIPIGTVMSRLHRGRKLLQAALLEHARERGIVRGAPRVPTPGGEEAG